MTQPCLWMAPTSARPWKLRGKADYVCGKPGQGEIISQLISAEHLLCFGKDTLYSLQLLTCSPWALLLHYLSNKFKLLRLPAVGGPATAAFAASCFSSCQAAAGIHSLHNSADWDFAPSWLPGTSTTTTPSREERSGKSFSLWILLSKILAFLNYIHLNAIRACRATTEMIRKRFLNSLHGWEPGIH